MGTGYSRRLPRFGVGSGSQAAEVSFVRTLIGLVAVTAVFLGTLAVGLRQTGSWDGPLPGLEATAPQEPTLRPQRWTTHNVAAAGVSIALPRGWRAIPTGRAGQLELAQLRKKHPRLAVLFGSSLAGDRTVPFRAFDVAGTAGARRDLFVTYVDVQRAPAKARTEAIWRNEADALREIPTLRGPVTRSSVHVPRAAAAVFRYRFQIDRFPASPLVLDVTRVSLVVRRMHYVVAFTTTEPQAAAYEPVFARSARSLRVLAGRAPVR
jgi:hypothetical protein